LAVAVGRLRPTRLGASAVLPPDCDPGVDPAIHAAPARLRDDSGDAGYSQGPYTESSPSRVSSGSAPAELSSPWIGARRRPTRRARSERAWLAPSTRQMCPNTIELLRPFSRKPSAFTRKFPCRASSGSSPCRTFVPSGSALAGGQLRNNALWPRPPLAVVLCAERRGWPGQARPGRWTVRPTATAIRAKCRLHSDIRTSRKALGAADAISLSATAICRRTNAAILPDRRAGKFRAWREQPGCRT
jgi:hypothetical protein